MARACKFCGEPDLEWEYTDYGWKLYSREGKIHSCSEGREHYRLQREEQAERERLDREAEELERQHRQEQRRLKKMGYKHTWKGHKGQDVESGHATFRVGGHVVEMELISFAEFQKVEGLLKAAHRLGAEQAKRRAMEALDELGPEL